MQPMAKNPCRLKYYEQDEFFCRQHLLLLNKYTYIHQTVSPCLCTTGIFSHNFTATPLKSRVVSVIQYFNLKETSPSTNIVYSRKDIQPKKLSGGSGNWSFTTATHAIGLQSCLKLRFPHIINSNC